MGKRKEKIEREKLKIRINKYELEQQNKREDSLNTKADNLITYNYTLVGILFLIFGLTEISEFYIFSQLNLILPIVISLIVSNRLAGLSDYKRLGEEDEYYEDTSEIPEEIENVCYKYLLDSNSKVNDERALRHKFAHNSLLISVFSILAFIITPLNFEWDLIITEHIKLLLVIALYICSAIIYINEKHKGE